MILVDPEKTDHLLALFRQSNLAAPIAEARRIYEDHLSAQAALGMAQLNAEHYLERWEQCREGIIVMRFEK
jgi:hypothetical protein